jgi:sulfite reductase alpha subunit-like flavoprotein
VGSPTWENQHAAWNDRVWPILLELSGARATRAAAARTTAENLAVGALTNADSSAAMAKSLQGEAVPREVLVPTILSNVVGIETVRARAMGCRELQAGGSPRRTRHLELNLPPGITYQAGDHLGVCPTNDEERVERLARRLGAALDGLFMVPENMNVHTVPNGVVLQVRNVLMNLVDITCRPPLPLLDLLLEKVTEPAERTRLLEIRAVLEARDGPDSSLRTVIDAGGYDALRLLDEFPSCSLNIFEFLRVASPLRPRYYSTSSSPRAHGSSVAHLTVGLEVTSVPDEPDCDFRGMSSHFLHAPRPTQRARRHHRQAQGPLAEL